MANTKRITFDWSETNIPVYCIIRRELDNYRLNDADGSFTSSPADPYLDLTEDSVIKGRYEVDESRITWNNGRYTFILYKQIGGSPVPTNDIIIGSGEMYVKDDLEIFLDASLTSVATALQSTINDLANVVEDDVVRDNNGNKTSSILYMYDSSENANTHDKVTGLLGTYNITASYINRRMSQFKSIKS